MDGFVREVCSDSTVSKKSIKCVNSDEFYDFVKVRGQKDTFSRLCSKDPYFYQACGDYPFTTKRFSNGDIYLCGFYVCQHNKTKKILSGVRVEDHHSCDGKNTCTSKVDERHCTIPENSYFTCNNNDKISEEKMCDRFCDCKYCEDELDCNGYDYSYQCASSSSRIAHVFRCSELIECKDESDEKDCPKKLGKCDTITPLTNYTRCTPLVACDDKSDQTNCSDSSLVGLKCKVHGYPTTISKNVICNQYLLTNKKNFYEFDELPICDDGIDVKCTKVTTKCFLHKHQLCDKIPDCEGSYADETSEICKEQFNEGCHRRVHNRELLLPLPVSWIGDGIKDCIDGVDENESRWPSCNYDAFNRVVLNTSLCEDVYICRNSNVKYISFSYLCDRINTCSDENNVCKASHDVTEPFTKSIFLEQNYYLSHCLPGLIRSVQETTRGCSRIIFPDVQILGTISNSLLVPKDKKDCSYFYGEGYMFLACSGKCLSTSCPIKSLLSHDSCSSQRRRKTFSLAAGNTLTLVKNSKRGFIVPNLFECQNGGCIPYSKVCNLADDCGDQSDELICQNNFVCNRNSTRFTISFISKNKICDGSIDCGDFSDECNEMCNKTVIKGIGLKASSFIIGILSLLLNFATVSKNTKSLGRVRTINVLQNRVLIILIGVGDGMVGGYLIAIAIIDHHYGNSLCKSQYSWLVSHSCSILGFVSTFGSQISLLSMMILSFTRFIEIAKSISIPLSVDKKGAIKVLAIATLLTAVSTIIAIFPLLIIFEDTFVNSVYFPDNPLFIGLMSKTVSLKVVSKYYGGKKYFSMEGSWRNILDLVKTMFTNQYNGVKFHLLKFYGNDAVCLFKFFGQAG